MKKPLKPKGTKKASGKKLSAKTPSAKSLASKDLGAAKAAASKSAVPKGGVKGAAVKFAGTPTASISSTREFYLEDFARTLFPLKTNRELILRGEAEIEEHISKCLDDKQPAYSFLPQRRVYASKSRLHLRRTVKLDPVSEYYIYDVVYRNRSLFRKPHSSGRSHYGYRFEGGAPIAPTAAYKGFKGAISEHSKKHKHSLSFDVASYFNNVYHHDIVNWFRELGAPPADIDGIGQMLREVNSGRSVDCLPQGLYPTKMIGNDFIRFVDNYHGIKSNELVRFMDDIYLFSDSERVVEDDFELIQRLLGDKGLSVNPQKTTKDTASHIDVEQEIDAVKRALLKRRRILVTEGYDEAGDAIVKRTMLRFPLNDDELGYINVLLEKPDLEEEDAELILTIMRDHASRVEKRLPYILREFPHLSKSVYAFCGSVIDKEGLADMLLAEAKSRERLTEFQLFWYGYILEDYLLETTKASSLIDVLFNHKSATSVSKAKILENPDLRFGLPELRHEFLASGQSDWLAWSSAVGSRNLQPGSRNQQLKYFAKSSMMNHLVATIMLKS